MARDLTPKQRAILEFIIGHIRDQGFPPTMAEIGREFGIASTNGVNDHLQALERKGFIERTSKARTIRVTDKAAMDLYGRDTGMAPVLGRVAAGAPVLAAENVESMIAVSAGAARNNCFGLRVSGDSMIEAGILHGDIVIVEPNRQPKPGDVVVALVEDEATVKYYHPHGAQVELRPANSAMKPMVFPAQDVQVQGVVVSLQRQFVG